MRYDDIALLMPCAQLAYINVRYSYKEFGIYALTSVSLKVKSTCSDLFGNPASFFFAFSVSESKKSSNINA